VSVEFEIGRNVIAEQVVLCIKQKPFSEGFVATTLLESQFILNSSPQDGICCCPDECP
jgi:hypothetical protein